MLEGPTCVGGWFHGSVMYTFEKGCDKINLCSILMSFYSKYIAISVTYDADQLPSRQNFTL